MQLPLGTSVHYRARTCSSRPWEARCGDVRIHSAEGQLAAVSGEEHPERLLAAQLGAP